MHSIGNKALTLVACTLIVAAFALAVSALTGEFRYWTFEERRLALANASRIQVPPIALSDTTGRTATVWQNASERQVYLVDFIYTRCATVCQTLGSEYQRMQQMLQQFPQQARHVKLLSISFDRRDRLEDLSGYARRYKAVPEMWTISRAADPASGRSLLDELGVVVIGDGMGGYVHNAAIHLVNGEGRLIDIYSYEDWEDAVNAALIHADKAPGSVEAGDVHS